MRFLLQSMLVPPSHRSWLSEGHCIFSEHTVYLQRLHVLEGPVGARLVGCNGCSDICIAMGLRNSTWLLQYPQRDMTWTL